MSSGIPVSSCRGWPVRRSTVANGLPCGDPGFHFGSLFRADPSITVRSSFFRMSSSVLTLAALSTPAISLGILKWRNVGLSVSARSVSVARYSWNSARLSSSCRLKAPSAAVRWNLRPFGGEISGASVAAERAPPTSSFRFSFVSMRFSISCAKRMRSRKLLSHVLVVYRDQDFHRHQWTEVMLQPRVVIDDFGSRRKQLHQLDRGLHTRACRPV